MWDKFFQIGQYIKIDINISPSYLYFKGIIESISDIEFIVKIDGQYIQKEPQTVKCTISNTSKTQVCIFETVIKSVENNKLILQTPGEKNVEIIQRRQYIRVPLDKEVNCYLIGINDRKIESNKTFLGIIKDISGGGVLLNSTLSLPVGTVLVFELELDNNKFLLTIRVLRNLENENNGTRDLGCQFIGIDETDRQMIISYCNKKQLSIKRRSKLAI